MTKPRTILDEPLLRPLFYLAIGGAAAWGLNQLATLTATLAPALIQGLGGWILAIALEPAVRRLARRTGRAAAALLTVASAGIILIAIVAWIAATVAGPLAVWATQPIDSARWREIAGGLASLFDGLGLDLGELLSAGDRGLREAIAPLASDLGSLAGEAAGIAGALVGTLIAASIFAAERGAGVRLIASLAGERAPRAARAVEETAERLGRLVRGHALAGALYALLLAPVLSLIGTPEPLLAAVAAGALLAVPALGPGLGILPVLADLALAGSPVALVVGLGACAVAWFVAANIVLPRLLAGSIGVPPAAVALAGILGGAVGGLPGAIISLPVLAVLAAVRVALASSRAVKTR